MLRVLSSSLGVLFALILASCVRGSVDGRTPLWPAGEATMLEAECLSGGGPGL